MLQYKKFLNSYVAELKSSHPTKDFELKIEKEGNCSFLRLYEDNDIVREYNYNCHPHHDILVEAGYKEMLQDIIKDSLKILDDVFSDIPLPTVIKRKETTLELDLTQQFGEVPLGNHKDELIVIYNTTDDYLEIDKIKINRKEFQIHNPPELPLVVEEGDYLALSVRFIPTKVGKRKATLKVGNQTIKLEGTGV